MRMGRLAMGLVTAVAIAVGAAACGGGSNPTGPSGGGGGGGTGGGGTGGGGTGGGGSVQTTTITIGADGRVTPADITVAPGSRVTFINSHNRNHEMNSDPHPDHGDCPGIDQIGFITPGQTKVSGNLNAIRTCGYHDHNEPTNTGLQGVIRVVAQ